MKNHSVSSYHMQNPQKPQILSSFYQSWSFAYDVIDELRHHSLSKYVLALYQNFIHEIAIFSSTCYTYVYFGTKKLNLHDLIL